MLTEQTLGEKSRREISLNVCSNTKWCIQDTGDTVMKVFSRREAVKANLHARAHSVVYQVIKSHRFGGMSNNSGQKAKIEGKNEQTFGAFTIEIVMVNWVKIRTNRRQSSDIEIKNGTGPRIDLPMSL